MILTLQFKSHLNPATHSYKTLQNLPINTHFLLHFQRERTQQEGAASHSLSPIFSLPLSLFPVLVSLLPLFFSLTENSLLSPSFLSLTAAPSPSHQNQPPPSLPLPLSATTVTPSPSLPHTKTSCHRHSLSLSQPPLPPSLTTTTIAITPPPSLSFLLPTASFPSPSLLLHRKPTNAIATPCFSLSHSNRRRPLPFSYRKPTNSATATATATASLSSSPDKHHRHRPLLPISPSRQPIIALSPSPKHSSCPLPRSPHTSATTPPPPPPSHHLLAAATATASLSVSLSLSPVSSLFLPRESAAPSLPPPKTTPLFLPLPDSRAEPLFLPRQSTRKSQNSLLLGIISP